MYLAAIELPDGRIVTGRSSHRMAASAAMILNAVKTLAGLADDIPVISAQVLENLQKMNVEFFGDKSALNCEEIIMALTMSTMTNPTADSCTQRADISCAAAELTAQQF